MQLQRILPQDKKFVADLFKDKQSSERIFSADEMKNKQNLHRLRSCVLRTPAATIPIGLKQREKSTVNS